MTDQTKANRRDQVLIAFHRDCTCPTVDQIIEWTTRYPEFAEDIREHAAILRDWAAEPCDEDEPADDLLLQRGRSFALNAIYEAQNAPAEDSEESFKTFDQLMEAQDLSTQKLSRSLGIAREVLADLFRGRMKSPVGKRLLDALMKEFRVGYEQFQEAFRYALANPSIGHAKANRQPTISQRSYEEVVRGSNMSEERKLFWLSDD